MNTSFKNILTSLTLISATTLASGLSAEEIISFHGQNPSKNDLINAFIAPDDDLPAGLLPANMGNGGVKFRGIKIYSNNSPEPLQQEIAGISSTGCPSSVRTVALTINFGFNSSKLDPSSNTLMEQIAATINSEQLKDCTFVVEGHTDAVGDERYNMSLSSERAFTVKRALAHLNVPSQRMISTGKGEQELINPNSPYAEENRRVQFRIVR